MLGAVGTYTLSNGHDIDVDPANIQGRLPDPAIFKHPDRYPVDLLQQAMKPDTERLEQSKVKDDASIEGLTTDQQKMRWTTYTWAHLWKGFVRSRLCARGFMQELHDLDDTYASHL